MKMIDEQKRIQAEFKEKMHAIQREELPGVGNSGFEIIFGKAWEDGHSYGYNEIEIFFRDECQFVKELLATLV